MNSFELQTAVRVSGLHREFGPRAILFDIDLQIAPGEFVALLGPSGCGKSTLLRALSALDPDVAGEIAVPERRAVVFQEPRLLPWKRVWRNVALGLRGRAGDTRRAAQAALEEVGLESHANAWPVTLSGGEAQRVALARALVREPQLLLLDEPFGALDALTRLKMHSLLWELWRRHRPAVLLVTHDVEEALSLADRALVLGPATSESGNNHDRPSRGNTLVAEVPIDLPRPRRRRDPRFAELRRALLGHLGVVLDSGNQEAALQSPPTPHKIRVA
jgi:sulfonate transport system ATP-binding protein